MSEELKKMEMTDILALIDGVNKTLDHDAYVPSQEKTVKIKTLNANHTKNILKSAMDGAFSTNQFNLVMYYILKDVVDFPLTNLTILDKIFLMIQLRIQNVSDEIEIELTPQKAENNKPIETIKQKLNLTKLLAKLKKEHVPFTDEIIENNSITVKLSLPSIEEEFQFENNLFKTKLSTIDDKNEKAVRSLFAPMFINNIAQFVSTVNINGTEIDMKAKNVNERLLIVEKLPAIVDKIIKKIDSAFGQQLSKVTNIEITKDNVIYQGSLDINAGFFVN